MSNIDAKVELLESRSVDALIDYLEDRDPQKAKIEKARVAQAAFASVQRRRSAENQRDALLFMMQRDGVSRRPQISESPNGATLS